jgi:glycosyltransferase involved in cell wall biosynthesis
MEIDVEAFARADIVVFPCEEAMEPYRATFPGFERLIENKDIRFILTGIDEPQRGSIPDNVFAESNGTLKLFYAGRHNQVKGYDLLRRVIPSYLDKNDALIAVAGKQGPLFAPAHGRWTELGWITNAPDVIARADAFILPNSQTYFDIIALEVMAVGRPLIASKTGGNRALAKLSSGIILFDFSESGLASALAQFTALSQTQRTELGQANRRAYEEYFTANAFAQNYVKEVLEH